jgi:hypothetical protein
MVRARRATGLALGFWLLAAPSPSGADPGAAPGDSLTAADEGRPVASVEVRARTIFDPVPPGRLAGMYRLANRLHVPTRPGTVRAHALLAPGDPWRAERARETERLLRALDIFDEVAVRAWRDGDSARVRIDTRDAWTTSPEFNLERGGGRTFGSLLFAERNLLGRAQEIAVAYREDPAGITRSIAVIDPGVGGSRIRLAGAASTGTTGTTADLFVGQPFHAQDAPRSWTVRAERVHSEALLFERNAEVARFARRNEKIELTVGRGRRLDGTIERIAGSLLVWDRAFGGVELAPGAPAEFVGGEERLRVRRFTAEARLWRPSFIARTAVDRIDAVEDFDVGRSVTIAAGLSPHWLGSTVSEGFAAVRGEIGADAGGPGFGWLRMRSSSRLIDGPREATVELDARWISQAVPRQTIVLAAFGGAAHRPARDFQYVVGGLNGLRAHGVHAVAGHRIARLNAESRWVIGRNYYQLVSLGMATFWDAARSWGPGSGGQSWQHDAGVGLRVSLPRSALNRVVRLDLGWRVSPRGVKPGGAVFSFGSSQAF